MKVASRVERQKEERPRARIENLSLLVAVVKSALGVVKKMLTNGGFVKWLWAYLGFARTGKALAVVEGRRIGDGSRNVLFNSLF